VGIAIFNFLFLAEPDPPHEQQAKPLESALSRCVAAAGLAVMFGAVGIWVILRHLGVPILGYVMLALGACYMFVFFDSLRRYRKMARGGF
jgi:hypothetical protein